MAVTRREFVVTGSLATAGLALAGPASALPKKNAAPHVAYGWSVRGRRASNATKEFCANMRFKTKHAAVAYPKPHPNFNGRLVHWDISANEFHRLFGRGNLVADLRQLNYLKIIGR